MHACAYTHDRMHMCTHAEARVPFFSDPGRHATCDHRVCCQCHISQPQPQLAGTVRVDSLRPTHDFRCNYFRDGCQAASIPTAAVKLILLIRVGVVSQTLNPIPSTRHFVLSLAALVVQLCPSVLSSCHRCCFDFATRPTRRCKQSCCLFL